MELFRNIADQTKAFQINGCVFNQHYGCLICWKLTLARLIIKIEMNMLNGFK